jgi:hypothetical protein
MAAFFLIAATRLAFGLASAVDPRLATANVHCSWTECSVVTDVSKLVPLARRDAVLGRPQAEMRLEQHLDQGRVRAALLLGEIVRALPWALVFACLALAFRRFALRPEVDSATLMWLRRASWSAIAAVVAQPIADTVRATALAPVVLGRDQLFIALNVGPFLWGLVIAGSAWAAVWLLEQAERAKAELAKFV